MVTRPSPPPLGGPPSPVDGVSVHLPAAALSPSWPPPGCSCCRAIPASCTLSAVPPATSSSWRRPLHRLCQVVPAPGFPDGGAAVKSELVTTPVASHPSPSPPPRPAAYSRRGRSSSSPVMASRRSARLDAARADSSPTLPILERAERRAVARNLETGTTDITASSSTCSFSALEASPLG